MNSSKSGDGDNFKAFVSETELEERRKQRQEEWEKVRQPDQPLEAPEEEYDPRSLYERLQEQKDKKQMEYEETHRLKNMVKGLETDEVEFLDLIDRTREQLETQKNKEEAREIADYRRAVSSLIDENEEKKLESLKRAANQATSSTTSNKRSQMSLLAGAVKRRSSSSAQGSDEKKLRKGDSSDVASSPIDREDAPSVDDEPSSENSSVTDLASAAVCIGVLPGVGAYTDSSDSDATSGSDIEHDGHIDMLGRARKVTRCVEH